MEMHQVRYFLAVADKLNFTRAAEHCDVTQPALTRAIKSLEEELGGPLFHRERTNTHLTELGRMVRPHLEHVYREALEAKRRAQDFTHLRNTMLKLGIMCTIAPDQIIDLIGSIQQRHPGVELQLSDANAWDLQERLLDGRLEVAIYCLPGREPDERTHVVPLFREQIVAAINPRHRLANASTIRVADLDGECYIHRMNCEFAGYADPVFAAQNVKCKAIYWSGRDGPGLGLYAGELGEASGRGRAADRRTGILAPGEHDHGARPPALAGGRRVAARSLAGQVVRPAGARLAPRGPGGREATGRGSRTGAA